MTEQTIGRPYRPLRNINAKIAAIPMALTALVVFLGGTAWTVLYSFTDSKLLPRLNFVGLEQYYRLWATPRWLVAVENLFIYGVLSLIFQLVIGFLLAVLMDQKIRFENAFRTIFLYPFALSFIVTGLVWQWILNPASRRAAGWCACSAGRASPSTRSAIRNIVIYGAGDRRALAGDGARHGADARRPARHRRGDLEGRPRRRHSRLADLHLHRHSDDAPGADHHARHRRLRHRPRLRSRRRA